MVDRAFSLKKCALKQTPKLERCRVNFNDTFKDHGKSVEKEALVASCASIYTLSVMLDNAMVRHVLRVDSSVDNVEAFHCAHCVSLW